MIDDQLHRKEELVFNKEGFLMSSSSTLTNVPTMTQDGTTIVQVAYVPVAKPKLQEKRTKLWSFRNAMNAILVISFSIFFVMVEFYGYGFSITSGFTCMDPTLSYKKQKDTISFPILMSGCIVIVPLLYLFAIWILSKKLTKKGVREIFVFYKEYLKGMLLVMTMCEALKALVVEPRPDFFDVCNPDTAANCTAGAYVESFMCQNFEKYGARKMFDSNRSFPSGHAAMSMFTTMFCWYIVETRYPTKKFGEGLKIVFLLAATAWTLFCSLTRITDRRHHFWDVMGGSFVGISCGIYSLNLIFKKYDKNSKTVNNSVFSKTFKRSNSLGKSIVR